MDRFTGLSTLLRHRRLTLCASSALVLLVTVAPLTYASPVNAATTAKMAASCNATADSIVAPATTKQLITVLAPSMRSTVATLEVFRRVGACFHLVDGPYGANVGSRGLSAHHHEGDDTTPIGLFGLQSTMYGNDANPGVAYRYHQLVCGDWWDEQSSSALYNHFVHVSCGATPSFGGDSEPLWEVRPQYDYFAVIEYNHSPVVPGRGSAIFLHVSIGAPTTGCVAIPRVDLLRVLRFLRPTLRPMIYISTRPLLAH
jgi:L,D-peptidoglycan transpeptidase YkuD (ErfK/YbiS/YcfS/YnhG family)